MSRIRIVRAGPLATVQDAGRFGMLRHGISASGPMDRAAFERIAGWLGGAGASGIEFTAAGLGFVVEEGSVAAGFDGGTFALTIAGEQRDWPARAVLKAGDAAEITPGPAGNYGYVRFDGDIEVPTVLGSKATNLIAGLGGLEGRALREGDVLSIGRPGRRLVSHHPVAREAIEGLIGVVWGLHADLFAPRARQAFIETPLRISGKLDRMGVRLDGGAEIFSGERKLSLVSDAIVPGDIQVLGDGTPIVLMRDHQPTGGYPRIATVVSADLDRFAQLRPGTEVRFVPMTVGHAQAAMR